jgi:hypothetical protein
MTFLKIAFSLVVWALCIISCTPSHENAEKGFLQIQVLSATTSVPMAYCFDTIRGLGQSGLPVCADSGSMYNLPLNINADTCLFIFTKKKRYDTVLVKYKTQLSLNQGEYYISYPTLSIDGISFKKFNTNCPTYNCNAQNFILYLYF